MDREHIKKILREELPLVSIITPSYNQGQFIEDTILSVKNQDYPNIQHIIIDSSSIDKSVGTHKNMKDRKARTITG